jgi:hypothetical protein
MSLSVCKDCTARYAPDLKSCPQCGSAESVPNWVADADAEAEAAADLYLIGDGDGDGFCGAEGLAVLRAAADGAGAETPAEDEPPHTPVAPPVPPPAPDDGAVTA